MADPEKQIREFEDALLAANALQLLHDGQPTATEAVTDDSYQDGVTVYIDSRLNTGILSQGFSEIADNGAKSRSSLIVPLRNCWTNESGIIGDPGPIGPTNTHQPAPGTGGSDGTIAISTDGGEIGEITNWTSESHLSSLLRAAEYDFLRGNRSASAEKLIWLIFLFGLISDAEAPSVRKHVAQQKSERAQVLLRRLELGLDYFGEPSSYVPRLTARFYRDRINSLVESARSIETSHSKYFEADAQNEELVGSIRETIFATKQRAKDIATDLAEVDRAFSSAQNRVISLRNDLDGLWQDIFKAEGDFRAAVERESSCDFFGTLMFIGSIATAVTTGVSALSAGTTALSALGNPTDADGNPIEDTIEYFKFGYKTIKPAGKSIAEFSKSYQEVRQALEPARGPEVPSLPSDQVKLLADKQDFDKAIGPFLNLPEAKRYKQLVESFISTAETRNNLILEVENMDLRLRDLRNELVQAEEEVNSAEGSLAANLDPRLTQFAEYMESANLRSKNLLALEIYRFAKAVGFFALEEPLQIDLEDFSVASLEASKVIVEDRFVRAKERYGQDAGRFSQKTVNILSLVTESVKEKFYETGLISFTIPMDHPEFEVYRNIKLGRAFVLPVFKGQRHGYRSVVFHHGQGLMRDRSNQSWIHVHQAVTAATEQTSEGVIQSDGTIIKDDSEFVGVSPFATWTARLSLDLGVQFEEIDELLIQFGGRGYAVL